MSIKKFNHFFLNEDDKAPLGQDTVKTDLTKIGKIASEMSKKLEENPNMDIDEWAKEHVRKAADNIEEVYNHMKFQNDSPDAEEEGLMEQAIPPIQREIGDLIRNTLKPGTDKGSTQGIIDTKDINVAAELIYNKFIKQFLKS